MEGEHVMRQGTKCSVLAYIALSTLLLCGCTRVFRPVYVSRGVFYEDFGGKAVRLLVHDDREEKDRIFYKDSPIIWREKDKGGYVCV